MKLTPYALLFICIVCYSLTIFTIEWQTSQEVVRHFLTDIGQGEVFFYAINTTFSYSLLWATALIFAVCLLCLEDNMPHRDGFFYWSQVIMFTYLGLDERFMFHEKLGAWLHHNDAYLLLGLGIIELGLLFSFGNLRQKPILARYFLFTAACFFAIMVVVDALFPAHMRLRLSLEELTKLWADLCLTLFAWEILRQQISRLKGKSYQN
jgi:hypothetical protein